METQGQKYFYIRVHVELPTTRSSWVFNLDRKKGLRTPACRTGRFVSL